MYAFVKAGANSANSNVTTFAPTNAGDLLVLVSRTSSGGGSPTITSVVDNNSVAWTQALATGLYGSGSANYVSVFFLPNCEAGITSVTCTYNGGTPGTTNIEILEYSGIATTSPLIGISTPNPQASPGTTANAITSNALSVASGVPALILGIVADGFDGDTVAGTGFTARVSGNGIWFAEDKRATATGSQTATATAPTHGGGDNYITFTMAFSEAGGGGISVGGSGSVGSGTAVSSLTTSATTTQTSGSSFAVCVTYSVSGSVTSVSDNKGNFYTAITSEVNNPTDGRYMRIYIFATGAGGAGHTATVSFSTAQAGSAIFVEIKGAAVSGITDAQNVVYDSSGSPFACSVTTANANDLLLGFIASASTSGTQSFSSTLLTNSITQFTNATSGFGAGGALSRVVSSTGIYNAAISDTAGFARALVGMLAIKQLSASSATLSSPTPSGTIGTGNSAVVGCTTDTVAGSLYAVIDTTTNITGITATQVVAGQNKNSVTAISSGNIAVTGLNMTLTLSGLSPNTTYGYALAQNNGANSNVVNGTFTTSTPTPLVQGARQTFVTEIIIQF